MSCELGMTVSRLRNELTDAEFGYYAAYYELKGALRRLDAMGDITAISQGLNTIVAQAIG